VGADGGFAHGPDRRVQARAVAPGGEDPDVLCHPGDGNQTASLPERVTAGRSTRRPEQGKYPLDFKLA
jgi:hypothetical protein